MNATKDPEYIPPYEGSDMAGYILKNGLNLYLNPAESVYSITNVKDTAIIVTNYTIFRAKPCYGVGFSVEVLSHI